ncbi:unnamed protein product [Mytilus coruscus]|uniref:Tc1-like transposase DDE domain-containing protein n=1 Tax=Mytilus coruscus TaxID=42192 RepID=A0A6J8C0H2_MYTCO|nr:unnamed protein product [Mytilus coruscus]
MSVFEPHCKGTHRKVPSGKGTRLIILDVGSSHQGLIPGCGLIFESKTNSSDYHDEMNKEHFTKWFRDALIPKLPPQSVVVMDNTPYHSHLDPESRYIIDELASANGHEILRTPYHYELNPIDGIRDKDVDPVVIDMTDDDSQDSQRTIPYIFSEGEEGNDVENDNDFEDSVSDTINDAYEILCNTCGSTEPPKPI